MIPKILFLPFFILFLLSCQKETTFPSDSLCLNDDIQLLWSDSITVDWAWRDTSITHSDTIFHFPSLAFEPIYIQDKLLIGLRDGDVENFQFEVRNAQTGELERKVKLYNAFELSNFKRLKWDGKLIYKRNGTIVTYDPLEEYIEFYLDTHESFTDFAILNDLCIAEHTDREKNIKSLQLFSLNDSEKKIRVIDSEYVSPNNISSDRYKDLSLWISSSNDTLLTYFKNAFGYIGGELCIYSITKKRTYLIKKIDSNVNLFTHKGKILTVEGDARCKKILCFDFETGNEIWKYTTAIGDWDHTLNFAKNLLLFSEPISLKHNLTALNIEDGGLVWQSPYEEPVSFRNGFSVIGNYAVFMNKENDGIVYAVDLEDGCIVFKEKITGQIASNPENNLLYLRDSIWIKAYPFPN